MSFLVLFPQVCAHHPLVIPDIDMPAGERRVTPGYAGTTPVKLVGCGFDQACAADNSQTLWRQFRDQQLSVFVEHPGKLAILDEMDVRPTVFGHG